MRDRTRLGAAAMVSWREAFTRRRTLAQWVATATALLALAPELSAQSWVGPLGGAWSLASNWDPKVVPNNAPPLTFVSPVIPMNGPTVDSSFQIAGLTNMGTVLVPLGGQLGFTGPAGNPGTTINNNGTISIAPGMLSSVIVFAGNTMGTATHTVTGNGTILLGGAGLARINGGTGAILHNVSNTIIGKGTLFEGAVALVNGGAITASGGSLTVSAAGYTNTGRLSAISGGQLRLGGGFGTMNNSGTILADGGHVLITQGLQIEGGTLAARNGGSISTGGGGLQTFRLSHVTNANGFIVSPGTTVEIEGAIDNRGNFSVGTNGTIRAIGAASLSGGGSILLQSATITGASTGASLVNTSNTIRGTGQINNLAINNELDGVITAAGGSLTISPGGTGLRNSGIVSVENGTLTLSGGTFDNVGGRIVAGDQSNIILTGGARIGGGTLAVSGSGTYTIPPLNNVMFRGLSVDGEVVIDGTLRARDQLRGGGMLRLRPGSRMRIRDRVRAMRLRIDRAARVEADPDEFSGPEGLVPELVNDGLIDGAGTLGANTLKITNNGTITANDGPASDPGILFVDPSPDGLLNAGVIESDDFGVLLLTGAGGGSYTQTGTALVRALGASSNVRLSGGTFSLSGGQFGSGGGSIAVDGGTTATLADLTSDALLTTGPGQATIVINQNVVNNGTVSLPAGGRLVVAGASTLNSASGHIASNGSITVNNNANLDANFIAGTGSLLVQSGGTLRAHAVRQARLTIDNGGFAHLKSAFAGSVDPSRVGSLTIGAAPAFLDVANRVLIVDQSGTIALNTLRAHIVNGYNGGAWDGPGIRSSVAAANPGFGVGYGEASAIFTSFPATYFGQTIDNTTLLLTYTRYGDANLDRVVNLQDFNRLAANFGQSNKLWTDGDFTYDGLVNLPDFNRLAANFGLSAAGPSVAPEDWAALAAAVPEPALVTICAVALLGMTCRPRRAAWCAALGTLVLASQPLLAQTAVTYVGPAGDVWHNPMNWMPQVIPDNNTIATNPIFYTTSIDRQVVVNGPLFDIAGMTNGGEVVTHTSWDFRAGIGAGAPFLNNTGTLLLQAGSPGSSTVLGIETGQTLTIDGGGIIRLGGDGMARIFGGGRLINQDNTIRGEGSLGEGVLSIINRGAILASANDSGGAGTLLVYPIPGDGMVNRNTLAALNNGNLVLRGEYSNASGTIIAQDGGTVHMSAPVIFGGTITTQGNGTILVSNQTAIWHGPVTHTGRTIVNSALVLFGEGSPVRNDGSITLNGQLRVNSLNALTGSGTILMNGGAINSVSATPTDFTSRNYITGHGTVGDGMTRIINELTGVIRANGGTLVIHARQGANFDFNAATITADGGTLVLRGGNWLNSSGLIHADNSVVRLESPMIEGGTLLSTGLGEFHVPLGHSASFLGPISVNARLVDAGGTNFSGLIDGSATLEFNGTQVNSIGSLTFAENVFTITKPGTRVRAAAGTFFTGGGGPDGEAVFTNNGTIAGAGTIGLNELELINNGVIRGDGAGTFSSLTLDPSASGMINTGTIEATGQGQVILTGSGGGSFTQSGGGLFTEGGIGVIRAADPGSNVHIFNNAQLTGGQLGAGAGSISAAAGTLTLQDLTNNANLVLLGVSTLMTTGNVVNNGTITTQGVGRMIVNGSLALGAGGAGHFANNGSLTVNSGAQLDANVIQGAGTTTVQTGGMLRAHAIRQSRLAINDAGSARLKSATPGSVDPSRLGTLTIGAAPAMLDVANRVLILDQSGAGPLNTLRAQIVSGHSGGAWDGPGINSSDAAADPGGAVGYGEASAIFTSFPATYFGQTIDSTTLIVTYTKYGDANLDRVVNLEDFNRLAANFGQLNRLWTQGEFTFDGVVNLEDFNRLAANFGLTSSRTELSPADWASLASVVPEPSLAACLPLLARALSRRGRPKPIASDRLYRAVRTALALPSRAVTPAD